MDGQAFELAVARAWWGHGALRPLPHPRDSSMWTLLHRLPSPPAPNALATRQSPLTLRLGRANDRITCLDEATRLLRCRLRPGRGATPAPNLLKRERKSIVYPSPLSKKHFARISPCLSGRSLKESPHPFNSTRLQERKLFTSHRPCPDATSNAFYHCRTDPMILN